MPRPNPEAAWQLGKVWRFGGPCQQQLYIEFSANQHTETAPQSCFAIGKADQSFHLHIRRVRPPVNGRFDLVYSTPTGIHTINTADGSFPIDTWIKANLSIDFRPTPATAQLLLDDVDQGSLDLDLGGLPIEQFALGSVFSNFLNASNSPASQNIDDLKIGTTGPGSDDLFSADFTATIVPPFTSLTDPHLALSISAGTFQTLYSSITPIFFVAYAVQPFSFP